MNASRQTSHVKENKKIDDAEKLFKRSIKEFKESVWNSRHFVEPENDNEVVHRLIETLVV